MRQLEDMLIMYRYKGCSWTEYADTRLGKPDEIADAVVMFVTCGYITGQSLLMYLSYPVNSNALLELEVSSKRALQSDRFLIQVLLNQLISKLLHPRSHDSHRFDKS